MEIRNYISKAKASSIDEKNYTIDFIMTIEVKDRSGDIVDVDTVNFKNFLLNPVVLPQHKHDNAPVGKVTSIWVEIIDGKKALIGRVKFAAAEYDLAMTYWKLYKGGYMSAVSIGFRPERGEMVDDAFVLYDSELMELSLVSIPANQLALAKSNGIDLSPVLKTISADDIKKELRDTLIGVKQLIEEMESEAESDTTETATTDVVETPDTTTPDVISEPDVVSQKSIGAKRSIKALNLAIRQLRGL